MVLGSWTLFISYLNGYEPSIRVGSIFQVIAYSLEASALPFPGFVFGYAVNGIGMALQVNSTFSKSY
jgi:hypothetical protein